ncbi:putative Dynein heavy chain N terminal region 2 domain1 [Trypanosoma vivax]|nr:putative Dynein heavy chain N terminal region 2 domain1 [Trypanosoma vivax]
MSISYKELIALRRAHLAEQSRLLSTSGGHEVVPPKCVETSSASALKANDDIGPRRSQQRNSRQEHLPPWLAEEGAKTAPLEHIPWSQCAQERYTKEKNVPLSEEPKVMVQLEAVGGDLPRNEVMRRWWKRYRDVSLEGLLKEKNILVDGQLPEEDHCSLQTIIPLHMFDDKGFEELSPSDWMAKRDEDGGVVCRVLLKDEQWRLVPGTVTSWNEENDMLTVRFARGKDAENQSGEDYDSTSELHRLYVCFDAENPRNFADRLESAFRLRKLLESTLREQLIADSIPSDEYQTIDPYALQRIHEMCLNTPKLHEYQSVLEVGKMLDDVRTDYSRVMNLQLLRHTTRRNGLKELMQDAELPAEFSPSVPKKCGVHVLRDNQFADTVAAFTRNSLIGRNSIAISILQCVRENNEALMARRVFCVSHEPDGQSSLTLSAFEDVQITSIRENAQYVRSKWLPGITSFVEDACAKCTESDGLTLNVRESEYEASKTRSLMNAIALMMEDSLRWQLTNAIVEFTAFLEEAAKYTVVVQGLANVEVVPHPDLKNARIVPLFKVSLIDGEEKPLVWSTPAPEFSKMLVDLILRCLTLHSGVRSVERRLISFLYDSNTTFVTCIDEKNPTVQTCIRKIQEVLECAGKPLDEYMKTYAEFEGLITLNVKEYVENFKQQFPTTKGVEEEIRQHTVKQKEVKARIPRLVNLGLFQVDCTELNKRLSAKCTQIVDALLEVMFNRANEKAMHVIDSFQSIRETLVKPTDTPEEVVERQEFIKKIPEKVFDLQTMITEIQQVYAILDTFCVPFSEESFNRKWTAIAWPARLDDDIMQKQVDLEQTKRSLTLSLRKSQEAFQEKVVQMQHTISTFSRRKNISKLNEIVSDVHSIQEHIQQLVETANQFNTHESLLVLDKTDYTIVRDLQSDFEPFASLWLTVHDWSTAIREWQSMPFTDIDAETMERRVMNNFQVITKCTRDPRLTETLTDIAKKTKTKIEEFKPIVPYVKYLRTEGMKDRHWDQASKEVGHEVRPGKTLMTLNDVRPLMSIEYEEIFLRISEVASREHQIETPYRG